MKIKRRFNKILVSTRIRIRALKKIVFCKRRKKTWNVKSSEFSSDSRNTLRTVIQHLFVNPNPDKSPIVLSIGKLTCPKNGRIKQK